ncbi:UNVERIFIED_CONTAM: hypothetical protein PYX00_006406 [Menopon gallinae]|uniref:Peptidyl-prolyl cis-trans isomerase n=1 Tax=Menopon gallinae TaxID=328185 RepID=A0AAW2HV96_9NEOP
MGIGTLVLCLVVCFLSVQAGEVVVTDKVFFDISIDDEPVGRIVIGLFGDIVPKTTKNFVVLASDGLDGKTYAGTQFHRVIKGFMIQGGDVINGDGTGTTSIYGHLFEDENFTVKHSEPGIISMANSGPDSNGCQFFITSAPTPWLDGKHVAFGKVLSGLDVISKIEDSKTDEEAKPLTPVVITKSGIIPSEPEKISIDTAE